MIIKSTTKIHVVQELPSIVEADFPALPSLRNFELQAARKDYAQQVVAASIIDACISAGVWKLVDFQCLIYHLKRWSLWILDTEAVSKAFWGMARKKIFFVVHVTEKIQPGGLYVVPTPSVYRIIEPFIKEDD